MAFNVGDDRVACYHWPGFNTDCEEYLDKFCALYSSLSAPVSKVYVLINDPEEMWPEYRDNLRKLEEWICGAPIICYVKEHIQTGDLHVKIAEDGGIEWLYDPYIEWDYNHVDLKGIM